MIEKKPIGKLPTYIGDYVSGKSYDKKNRVTLYGSEFESKADGNTYAPATLDSEAKTVTFDTEHWAVISNGTSAFLAGEKLDQFSFEDNPEFVSANTDSEGKLLESTDVEGKKTFYGNLEVKGSLKNDSLTAQIEEFTGNKVDKVEGKSLIDENVANSLSEEDNPEYAAVNVDADNKVIDSVGNDGIVTHNTKHVFKSGLSDPTDGLNKSALQYAIDNSSDLAKALKEGGYLFSATDWTDASNIHIPIPQCAYANIIGDLPTTKGNTTKAVIHFWDMQGNYFKKYAEVDIHGRTSAVFAKKNYTLDLYNDSECSNEFKIKFGDWVEMDSYYFQGWYTDSFRGIDVIGYQLWQQIIATRGVLKDRPYKYNLYDGFTTTTDSDKGIDINLTANALCTPMAFPLILYHNGDFLGIYTIMLKKNRANFLMDKKDYSAVMIDPDEGNITWGDMDWATFEIRNPKTLICMDGSKYDGDNPKELIDETSESFDNNDKDMKNTVITKTALKGLANAYKEIAQAVTDGKTNEEIRSLIDKYYNVDYFIDYIIFINAIQDTDAWSSNWQWTTWDGIKWNPNPYDLNASFGLSPYGNTCSAPATTMAGTTANRIPLFIITYYKAELESRYKELVDNGILTSSHIQHLFKTWVERIGSEAFEKEFEKWPNTPSQRDSNINSDYWKRITTNQINVAWNTSVNYAKEALVGYPNMSGHVYKSLVANNIGNNPSTETSSWEDITYDSTKSYSPGDVAYMVKDGRMGFESIQSSQGIPPLSKIYDERYGLCGWHDSLPRVYKWIEEKMANMNTIFNYN